MSSPELGLSESMKMSSGQSLRLGSRTKTEYGARNRVLAKVAKGRTCPGRGRFSSRGKRGGGPFVGLFVCLVLVCFDIVLI